MERAISALRLTPVLFEAGARPHPPREVYRAYLEQSDIFIGLYWQRYGQVNPGVDISGLEEELRLSAGMPRLLYVKVPAPDREPRLAELLAQGGDCQGGGRRPDRADGPPAPGTAAGRDRDPYLHAAVRLVMAWTSNMVGNFERASREADASLEEFRGQDELLGSASAALTLGSWRRPSAGTTTLCATCAKGTTWRSGPVTPGCPPPPVRSLAPWR